MSDLSDLRTCLSRIQKDVLNLIDENTRLKKENEKLRQENELLKKIAKENVVLKRQTSELLRRLNFLTVYVN